jgi:hypothetical protein
MPLSERIVVDPEILAGKSVIRGTRLAVSSFWDCSLPVSLRASF